MDDVGQECCPYFERMGVCLEPEACFLRHKTMNIQAQEFNPNAASFQPIDAGQIDSTNSTEAALKEFEKGLGAITTFGDSEYGQLYYVETRASCDCCKGYVNNCSGEACANLGICFCMVADEEDLQ